MLRNKGEALSPFAILNFRIPVSQLQHSFLAKSRLPVYT
jgi:hypothetical protein